MATFTRSMAVLVGLVNLVLVASTGGNGAPLWTGEVTWAGAAWTVLTVVFVGLLVSELVLRWFRSLILDERFFVRYGAVMFVITLAGVLMGGLLTAVLVLSAALTPGPPTTLGQAAAALVVCFTEAGFGLALGLAEGFILALPLAAILGRFRGRG